MGGACSRYGGEESIYRVLMGKPEGKEHLEDPGVDGRIILGWIFREWDMEVWIGSIGLRTGTVDGHL
jgi:hypothetical protein